MCKFLREMATPSFIVKGACIFTCKCPSRLHRLLKGECVNQKAKPHKPSMVIGVQNDIGVLGLVHFVLEDFEDNAQTKRLAYKLVEDL